MLLSLPVIHADVPKRYTLNQASALQFGQALCLSRTGAIQPAELETLCANSLSAIDLDRIIAAGWTHLLGDFAEFNSLSVTTRLMYGTQLDFPTSDAKQDRPILFSVAAAYPTWISIGSAIEHLESHCPGTGVLLTDALDRVLCLFGQPLTVSCFQQLAEYTWWYGEEDETAVLDECGEDCDVPRRDDLFAGLPQWLYDYKVAASVREQVTWDAVSNAFASTDDAALIAACRALTTLPIQHDREAEEGLLPYGDEVEESIPVEPPVVLYWKEQAQFNQLIDDHMQQFYESGNNAPWALEYRFYPNATSISDALKRITHTGNVLKALDHALTLLSDLNESLTP